MDGPGRPALYKTEFAAQAFELCLAGATNRDLADAFEVGHSTIDNWLQKHPEFSQSVKRGRDLADGRVAHGLYSRAIGYTYETTRAVLHRGELITVPHTVHKPPDVRACTFWLRNRRPQQWRDGPKPVDDEGPDLSAALNEAFERARLAAAAEAAGSTSVESASAQRLEDAHVVGDGGAAHVEHAADPGLGQLQAAGRGARELHGRHHVHGNAGGANRVALGLEPTRDIDRQLAVALDPALVDGPLALAGSGESHRLVLDQLG
jgi:hypothetical protein